MPNPMMNRPTRNTATWVPNIDRALPHNLMQQKTTIVSFLPDLSCKNTFHNELSFHGLEYRDYDVVCHLKSHPPVHKSQLCLCIMVRERTDTERGSNKSDSNLHLFHLFHCIFHKFSYTEMLPEKATEPYLKYASWIIQTDLKLFQKRKRRPNYRPWKLSMQTGWWYSSHRPD